MDIDWNTVLTIIGLLNLSYYRLHKKYKRERNVNLREWADGNLVEIIHAAVIIPQWGVWITGFATRIIGG